VSNTDKEYGKLDRNGELRNIGIIVEDWMVFDEVHKAVEDKR